MEATGTITMTTGEADRIQAAIDLVAARQEEQIECTEELRRMLYGNGDVGFAERIRSLERVAASIASWGRWMKFGVGGLVVKALWDVIQNQQVAS